MILWTEVVTITDPSHLIYNDMTVQGQRFCLACSGEEYELLPVANNGEFCLIERVLTDYPTCEECNRIYLQHQLGE